MRTPLSVFIILLVSGFMFCQNRSGEVTYKVKFRYDPEATTDTLKNNRVKQVFLKQVNTIKNNTPYLRFTLAFTKEKAIFSSPDVMNNDNGSDLQKTRRMAGAGGLFYTDLAQQINLHQFRAINKCLLLKSDIDSLKWHLHDETRQIKGFTCQKATTKTSINRGKQEKITVWFCPELPFQFGPLGFCGLPGLILGLERNHYYFYADTIKLKTSKKHITRPKDGEEISWNDYLRMMEKAEKNSPY